MYAIPVRPAAIIHIQEEKRRGTHIEVNVRRVPPPCRE